MKKLKLIIVSFALANASIVHAQAAPKTDAQCLAWVKAALQADEALKITPQFKGSNSELVAQMRASGASSCQIETALRKKLGVQVGD